MLPQFHIPTALVSRSFMFYEFDRVVAKRKKTHGGGVTYTVPAEVILH